MSYWTITYNSLLLLLFTVAFQTKKTKCSKLNGVTKWIFLFLYFLSSYLDHTQILPLWKNIPVRTAMLQCNSISSISNSIPNGVKGAVWVIDSHVFQYSCIPYKSIISIFYLCKYGEQKKKIGFKVGILSHIDRIKKVTLVYI